MFICCDKFETIVIHLYNFDSTVLISYCLEYMPSDGANVAMNLIGCLILISLCLTS